MENRGYFFIDGSHLFSSVTELWREKPKYKDRKLRIRQFCEALMRKWSIHAGATVRIIFYFKIGDSRMDKMLDIPPSTSPGGKDHWIIKECGESVGSIPEEELQKLSPKYRGYYPRAEKGLDIKLACDAVSLSSSGRASNFIFLLNDRDYLPLFESIQDFGGNVYLTALDSNQGVNEKLADLTDKYLSLDDELDNIFGVTEEQVRQVLEQESNSVPPQPISEK